MGENHLPCTICFETIRQKSRVSNSISEKSFEVFTKYFEVRPLSSDFNFPVEPFPFCDLCRLELGGILKLHELVESLQQNIKRQVYGLTVKLIESADRHEKQGKSSQIFQDRIASFRQSIRKDGKAPGETVEVSRTSASEAMRRKIMDIRRRICSRYDVRVNLSKYPGGRDVKTIAKPDEFPNDQGGLCNEEGVPADLDFSDVPMDDDFVFEQEEIDSVIEKGKAATSFSPSKVVPPEDLSIGMEVEVNFATEGVPTVKEIQGVTESSIAEEVEVGPPPPPLPEPPVVKEIDQTKYLSSKLYPVNEVSPGLFTFGDHSSFRQKREEEGGGYACENCEYHCQRRNQIFYHMRRAHTEKSSAENIFGDGSENNTGEVTSESNLTTRYFPLNLNRTVEVSPGKFEYASKYRFEKRGDQYVCETCGEIIPTRNRMMTHLRYRHYFAGRYECELCPKSFSQASKLKSHMEYHSESPQHICDECGVACKSSRCLYNHKQRKHAVEDAKYMCDQCGKYFPSKIGLKSHLSWHANSFQCSKCEDKFPDKKSLVVHRNSHRTAPKMQKCVQCHEEFKTELQLAEHVASAHTEDPTNVVMATVESEQVAKPTAAINNDDTIACNKPEDGKGFPCPKCAKVLKFRKYLSDHMKIHEQKKLEFRCKICGKEAMKKSNVRSHIGYVHGRQYLTKNDAFVEDLREQIPRAGPPKTMERSHTYKSSRFKYELEYNEDGTPKGFQCSECKIVLKKQEYLQEHIKFKHRDGKNIKCKMCGKEFRKQYDCRLHMQKIHHVTVKHEGRKLTKKKKSDDEDESNINESSE